MISAMSLLARFLEYVRRKKGKGFEVGRIAGWAAGRGYKHLVIVNDDMKKPSECPPCCTGTCVDGALPQMPLHWFKSTQRTYGVFQAHICGA